MEYFLPVGKITAERDGPVNLINYKALIFTGSIDCTVRLCLRYLRKVEIHF